MFPAPGHSEEILCSTYPSSSSENLPPPSCIIPLAPPNRCPRAASPRTTPPGTADVAARLSLARPKRLRPTRTSTPPSSPS
eukprot:1158126-Pelagomonas_calceolata.AAC.5